MKVIYRISETGYNKVKPNYINNKKCFENAVNVFGGHPILVICDNTKKETDDMIDVYNNCIIHKCSVGHGAGTFNLALNEALKWSDDEIVYFLENDYIHKAGSDLLIEEAFSIGADYVTLYDHPDKYIPANRGGNPLVDVDGGELTKVFLSKSSHWKLTNSTTMTFAAKVKTLREDESVLRKWTNTKHPHDMNMFLELRENGRTLLSSIPGYSTHGETAWLSPLTDWSKI